LTTTKADPCTLLPCRCSANTTAADAPRMVEGCQGAGGDRGAADLELGHWESGRESSPVGRPRRAARRLEEAKTKWKES